MHLTALQTFYEFEIKEFKYYKLIFLLLLKYNVKEMTTNNIKVVHFIEPIKEIEKLTINCA